MLILDRQNKVLEYVKRNRVATVAELANVFEVHDATIRRDLSLLEKQDKLKRTHGGVMIDDEVQSEPPFQERESVNVEEKKKIGELASEFVEDGSNIIIDSGTTTFHIIDSIMDRKNLTVITNDINIAAELRFAPSIKVIVTGGVLFSKSFMLNGMITDEVLKQLHVHTAFIGTPAFHHKLGLTHFDEQLVPAKRAMIKSAKKVITLTDHTKIGKVSLHTVANMSDIDILITSKQLEDKKRKDLKGMDIEVRFA